MNYRIAKAFIIFCALVTNVSLIALVLKIQTLAANLRRAEDSLGVADKTLDKAIEIIQRLQDELQAERNRRPKPPLPSP